MRRTFRLLVDTCVWLDLAKDYRQLALLDALEELIDHGEVEVILPRTVVDEFERNKSRVLEDASRGVASTLKRARELVERLADDGEKAAALTQLDEVDYRVPRLRESAIEALTRIESIFVKCGVTETSETVVNSAAHRALSGAAPFHRSKNSMGDAVIFETYLEALEVEDATSYRYAFVSHNTKDFSQPSGDNRLPHPDLEHYFTKVKSLYFISLAAALERIAPETVSYAMFEREWHDDARGLTEIVEALNELVDRLWYGRHKGWAHQVETGRIRIIDRDEEVDPTEFPRPFYRDIWDGALRAAARVEKQYGLETLAPLDDFEWGMLSGKVSALRWVLGDEWDMLDS